MFVLRSLGYQGECITVISHDSDFMCGAGWLLMLRPFKSTFQLKWTHNIRPHSCVAMFFCFCYFLSSSHPEYMRPFIWPRLFSILSVFFFFWEPTTSPFLQAAVRFLYVFDFYFCPLLDISLCTSLNFSSLRNWAFLSVTLLLLLQHT